MKDSRLASGARSSSSFHPQHEQQQQQQQFQQQIALMSRGDSFELLPSLMMSPSPPLSPHQSTAHSYPTKQNVSKSIVKPVRVSRRTLNHEGLAVLEPKKKSTTVVPFAPTHAPRPLYEATHHSQSSPPKTNAPAHRRRPLTEQETLEIARAVAYSRVRRAQQLEQRRGQDIMVQPKLKSKSSKEKAPVKEVFATRSPPPEQHEPPQSPRRESMEEERTPTSPLSSSFQSPTRGRPSPPRSGMQREVLPRRSASPSPPRKGQRISFEEHISAKPPSMADKLQLQKENDKKKKQDSNNKKKAQTTAKDSKKTSSDVRDTKKMDAEGTTDQPTKPARTTAISSPIATTEEKQVTGKKQMMTSTPEASKPTTNVKAEPTTSPSPKDQTVSKAAAKEGDKQVRGNEEPQQQDEEANAKDQNKLLATAAAAASVAAVTAAVKTKNSKSKFNTSPTRGAATGAAVSKESKSVTPRNASPTRRRNASPMRSGKSSPSRRRNASPTRRGPLNLFRRSTKKTPEPLNHAISMDAIEVIYHKDDDDKASNNKIINRLKRNKAPTEMVMYLQNAPTYSWDETIPDEMMEENPVVTESRSLPMETPAPSKKQEQQPKQQQSNQQQSNQQQSNQQQLDDPYILIPNTMSLEEKLEVKNLAMLENPSTVDGNETDDERESEDEPETPTKQQVPVLPTMQQVPKQEISKQENKSVPNKTVEPVQQTEDSLARTLSMEEVTEIKQMALLENPSTSTLDEQEPEQKPGTDQFISMKPLWSEEIFIGGEEEEDEESMSEKKKNKKTGRKKKNWLFSSKKKPVATMKKTCGAVVDGNNDDETLSLAKSRSFSPPKARSVVVAKAKVATKQEKTATSAKSTKVYPQEKKVAAPKSLKTLTKDKIVAQEKEAPTPKKEAKQEKKVAAPKSLKTMTKEKSVVKEQKAPAPEAEAKQEKKVEAPFSPKTLTKDKVVVKEKESSAPTPPSSPMSNSSPKSSNTAAIVGASVAGVAALGTAAALSTSDKKANATSPKEGGRKLAFFGGRRVKATQLELENAKLKAQLQEMENEKLRQRLLELEQGQGDAQLDSPPRTLLLPALNENTHAGPSDQNVQFHLPLDDELNLKNNTNDNARRNSTPVAAQASVGSLESMDVLLLDDASQTAVYASNRKLPPVKQSSLETSVEEGSLCSEDGDDYDSTLAVNPMKLYGQDEKVSFINELACTMSEMFGTDTCSVCSVDTAENEAFEPIRR